MRQYPARVGRAALFALLVSLWRGGFNVHVRPSFGKLGRRGSRDHWTQHCGHVCSDVGSMPCLFVLGSGFIFRHVHELSVLQSSVVSRAAGPYRWVIAWSVEYDEAREGSGTNNAQPPA